MSGVQIQSWDFTPIIFYGPDHEILPLKLVRGLSCRGDWFWRLLKRGQKNSVSDIIIDGCPSCTIHNVKRAKSMNLMQC